MTGAKRIERFPIRSTCPRIYLGANLNELTVSKKVEYNYQALVSENLLSLNSVFRLHSYFECINKALI